MVTTLWLALTLAGAGATAERAQPPQPPVAPSAWYLDDGLKKIPAGVKDDDLRALHQKLSALKLEKDTRETTDAYAARMARLQQDPLVGSKGFDDVFVTTIEQVQLSYDVAAERATLSVTFEDAAPADNSSTSGLIHVVDKLSTDLGKVDARGGKPKGAAVTKRKVLEQSIMFLSRSRTLWVRTDEQNRLIMADVLVKKNAINELKGRVAARLVFKALPLPVREIDDTALPSAENPVEVQTRNAVMAAELLSVVFYDRKSGDVLVVVK